MSIDTSRHAPVSADLGLTTKKIKTLREYVKRTIHEWSVPGLAVAVVKGKDVVFAEGIGYRDLKHRLRVTPNTQFSIGSSTKAFTTTAFQLLVDDGILSWTNPIRKIVPTFRLHDMWISEHINALDFAVHRSGLPSHDPLWMFNPRATFADIVSVAEHLEPAAPFRTQFIYNNFGYIVLGHIIEITAGQPWQTFVTRRILEPLGMNATTFSVAAMRASDDFSLAYADVDGTVQTVSPPELGPGAPAGAINATALDMARWLQLQLSKGQINGHALIEPNSMGYLHTPHVVLPNKDQPEITFPGYGLGWIVDAYRGRHRVHHGGNTFGFSSQVALMPEEQLGVVVLANAMGTPVPYIVANHIADIALDLAPIDWSDVYKTRAAKEKAMEESDLTEAPERRDTLPPYPIHEYAGTFEHPAYGQLHIEVKEGSLVAAFHDAGIPLVHWHVDEFRGPLHPLMPTPVPFTFNRDGNGRVHQVSVGFEPLISPIPFRRHCP